LSWIFIKTHKLAMPKGWVFQFKFYYNYTIFGMKLVQSMHIYAPWVHDELLYILVCNFPKTNPYSKFHFQCQLLQLTKKLGFTKKNKLRKCNLDVKKFKKNSNTLIKMIETPWDGDGMMNSQLTWKLCS